MKNEIKEIYLSNENSRFIGTHDNMGCVMINGILTKNITYEEYVGIISKAKYFLLVDKDYITNLQTIEHQYSAILSENAELENKITNLQEKLKVSQTNEETNRLEMQDITKILGLDEHTTFDEVKEYATNLQEKVDKYENPDDLTLFYMWLDEKAKDKMKQLQEENKRLQDRNKELVLENISLELERNTYKSRNEKTNTLLDELLERAYIDGEYIMYDYSTSELLEVKQALEGEDKDE